MFGQVWLKLKSKPRNCQTATNNPLLVESRLLGSLLALTLTVFATPAMPSENPIVDCSTTFMTPQFQALDFREPYGGRRTLEGFP